MQVNKGRAPKINNTKLPSAFSINKLEEYNPQSIQQKQDKKMQELEQIQQYKQNQQLLEPIDTAISKKNSKKEKKNPLSPLKNYMKQFVQVEHQIQDLGPQYNVQNIIQSQNYPSKLVLDEMITLSHLKKCRGQSGAVKKMLHVPSLQIFACKEEPIYNKESRIQLKQWLQFIQNNPHRHIIQIFTTFWNTPEGYMSILMDHAQMSLQDLLESVGSLPENVVQMVTYCVLQALRHIHNQGQYHGYLIPSQVLFYEEGIKLGLGISIRNHQQEQSKNLIEQPIISLFDRNAFNFLKIKEENQLPQLQSNDIFKLGLLLLQTAVGNFDVLDLDEHDMESFRQKFVKSPNICCLLHYQANTGNQTARYFLKQDLFQMYSFSSDFEDFLCKCLQFDQKMRPNIKALMFHNFIQKNLDDILSLKDLIQISNQIILGQNWTQLPQQYRAASENQFDRIQEAMMMIIQNSKKHQIFLSNVQQLNEKSPAIKELSYDLGFSKEVTFQKLQDITRDL